MNTQQRLAKLEQATSPQKDTREPMLVEFIGNDDDDPDDTRAILYIYNGENKGTYNLNAQELKEYEASNLPAVKWVNSVPRPVRAI